MNKAAKIRVVEIVGPAGAGKTTLYRALEHCPEKIRLENFPDVRKITDAPFFILNGLKLVPRLLHLHRFNGRQLSRREFAWMSILRGWSSLLRKKLKENERVIILDQGPVYLLAEMHLFGPAYLEQESAESLWQDLYCRWAATLDAIIWLDAPDDVLLDRIRSRQQEHIVKSQPAEVVMKFLNRYREEYDVLLSILMERNASIKLIKFDTRQHQTQNIVNAFLSEFNYSKSVT